MTPSSGRRRGRAALALAGAALLLLSACTAGEEPTSAPSATPTQATETPTPSAPSASPSAEPTPSAEPESSAEPEPTTANARIRPVPRAQWRRMVAAGMVYDACPVRSRDVLRRVVVNHHKYDGTVARGVLVVNADVARSVARIMTRLFDAEFPIRRMEPVEAYDGDTLRSLQADNTSAFNCRRPDQINAPPTASPHANGRAIDINPRRNPWMDLRCECWSPSARFADRTPGPGKVLEGGVVWKAFIDEGWVWQNIDVPDYMHFDTGYPSRPFDDTAD
ncbi:MAG: M15 family metallopeptidase [Nocardioides sp.]|nr:M15 family metallopeptidase [Nocardioides sp.]